MFYRSVKFLLESFQSYLLVLASFLLGKSRFFPLSPPFFKDQFFFDKKNKKFFYIKIRDWSDFYVIRELFYKHELNLSFLRRYKDIDNFYKNNKKLLILDLGGNIGLSAKYFSLTWKKTKILSIEPEINNLILAKKNNFGNKNIKTLNGAVGPKNSKGFVFHPKEGEEFKGNGAFRVDLINKIKIKKNKKNINFYSIKNILLKFRNHKPFILKIDIEGFEESLFKFNTEWVRKFPVIIIELHDYIFPRLGNSRNFLKTIAKENVDFIIVKNHVVIVSNTLL